MRRNRGWSGRADGQVVFCQLRETSWKKEFLGWYKNKSRFHANIAPMKFDHVVQMDKFNLILKQRVGSGLASVQIACVGKNVGTVKTFKKNVKKVALGHQNPLWILPNTLGRVGDFCLPNTRCLGTN